MDEIIQRYRSKIGHLMSSERMSFDDSLQQKLKEKGQGVYRVIKKDSNDTIYVGQTKKRTLQKRVYSSLLKGGEGSHTLKRKLIKRGICHNVESAKRYLNEMCQVQIFEEANDRERALLEHFAISVFNPEHND